MMDVLWLDVDGTIADCNHRRHHIRNGNKDWKSFLGNMHLDPVIEPVAKIARIISKTIPVICCTGRGEEYRTMTETWLRNNDIPYTKLYMRSKDDMRADHVIKIELLNQIRADGYNPIVAIDDRHSVVSALRQNGVTVLQCSDWDETQSQAGVTLDIMVGPSGSGKTTYVRNTYPSEHVVSSDQIRKDLCGDFKDQSRNDDVFAALHSIVKTRLCHGLPVVVDATNIRRKDRMQTALLGLPNAKVRYIVINRSLEDKRRDGDWRNKLDFDLLDRHEQTFNSNLKDILNGDGLDVEVVDLRS